MIDKCDICKRRFDADDLFAYEETGATEAEFICEDCLAKIFTKGGSFYVRQE